MKLGVSMDSEYLYWVFAEYESGKRVTKNMVTFDTEREDVHVNKYGVVLFQNTYIANVLLEKHFGVK